MALTQEVPRFETPQVSSGTIVAPASYERRIYPALRFYPNGLIDLKPINRKSPDSSHINGLAYEEHGMREVDKMIPDGHLAIGSHLLDAATIRTDLERGGNGRPDVMEFDWTGKLIRMFEFKRIIIGEYYQKNLQRKLIGISSLLKKLRANPNRLGELIINATGQDLLPSPISIPPDHELQPVTFVSIIDHREEVIRVEGLDLSGVFKTIPLQPSTSS